MEDFIVSRYSSQYSQQIEQIKQKQEKLEFPYFNTISIEQFKDEVPIKIEKTNSTITFHMKGGIKYRMEHLQNCCEHVFIEDICGDLEDLIGCPIIEAEEVINRRLAPYNEYDDSYTWTFYKLRGINGGVTIRWYGGSNGYYSERVDILQI